VLSKLLFSQRVQISVILLVIVVAFVDALPLLPMTRLAMQTDGIAPQAGTWEEPGLHPARSGGLRCSTPECVPTQREFRDRLF
jgi:hypothetical protein